MFITCAVILTESRMNTETDTYFCY